ncbi:MAG: hypothetical protein JW928_06780, partial [Candidatus Aureabacteria bacterium]|nr:hypothetical protein [Candidatus Auribacterota bacterium]
VNKKSGFVMHFFEVYLLVKNYLVLESEKVKYGIPHNTRYILVLMVPERLAPRIRHAFQDILEGFDIIPNLPPKNTVTNITRSQLFTLYEEKIKRAEYLLERTTIDVGNQFRALLDYKSAIWIAIEYENLGGSSKHRSDLIKKTVEMNEDLKKQYTTCQFNIKKGFALRNRNLIRESAEKIMELFPDPENYKHIEAKRVYNQFRKR